MAAEDSTRDAFLEAVNVAANEHELTPESVPARCRLCGSLVEGPYPAWQPPPPYCAGTHRHGWCSRERLWFAAAD